MGPLDPWGHLGPNLGVLKLGLIFGSQVWGPSLGPKFGFPNCSPIWIPKMCVPNLGPRVGSRIRLPFLNPLAPLPPFGPFGLFGPFEPLGPFGPFWPFGPLWDPWNPFWTLGSLWGPLAILGTISETTIECSPNLRLKVLELCDLRDFLQALQEGR